MWHNHLALCPCPSNMEFLRLPAPRGSSRPGGWIPWSAHYSPFSSANLRHRQHDLIPKQPVITRTFLHDLSGFPRSLRGIETCFLDDETCSDSVDVSSYGSRSCQNTGGQESRRLHPPPARLYIPLGCALVQPDMIVQARGHPQEGSEAR